MKRKLIITSLCGLLVLARFEVSAQLAISDPQKRAKDRSGKSPKKKPEEKRPIIQSLKPRIDPLKKEYAEWLTRVSTRGFYEKYAPQRLKEWMQAAKMRNPIAQVFVGSCYLNGIGLKQDAQEGFYWYNQAAKSGFAPALHNLGYCHEHGKGTQKDLFEAARWYHKAAKKGYARSESRLGQCYQHGRGVIKDAVEAVRRYRIAISKGIVQAKNHLGLCFLKGIGVIENQQMGLKLIREAADAGCAMAMNNLGYFYLNGYHGLPRDDRKAFKYFTLAGEKGWEMAWSNLGLCYLEGRGVDRDVKTGVSWVLKAVEKDFVPAFNQLGKLYFRGVGVERNPKVGLRLIQKAAERGFTPAMINLYHLHRKNIIGPDRKLALSWLTRAKEKGDVTALFLLGICYTQGYGVVYNQRTGEDLIQQAAEKGHAAAKRYVENNLPKPVTTESNYGRPVLEKFVPLGPSPIGKSGIQKVPIPVYPEKRIRRDIPRIELPKVIPPGSGLRPRPIRVVPPRW